MNKRGNVIDPIDKTKLQLNLGATGSFDYGLVKYGTGKDQLSETVLAIMRKWIYPRNRF